MISFITELVMLSHVHAWYCHRFQTGAQFWYGMPSYHLRDVYDNMTVVQSCGQFIFHNGDHTDEIAFFILKKGALRCTRPVNPGILRVNVFV